MLFVNVMCSSAHSSQIVFLPKKSFAIVVNIAAMILPVAVVKVLACRFQVYWDDITAGFMHEWVCLFG